MKVSIIIPVFNEENTISYVIDKVKSINLANIQKEIIIVDDGSTDNSRQIIESKNNIVKVYHQKNEGKGICIKTALPFVTGDYILIQDADLEYNPKDYSLLIEPIFKNNADVVYGARFLKRRTYPLFYYPIYLGNKFLTWLINILYNAKLNDMETCYKLIGTDLLKDLTIESSRFEFESEITIKLLKKNIRIYEVPIDYTPRPVRLSKKNIFTDGIKALVAIFKFRFRK